MRRKTTILLFTGLLCLSSFNISDNTIFYFGKKTCTLRTHGNKNPFATFVALHDNENTAVEAFHLIRNDIPGIVLFEIHQNGERLLKYELNNKDYLFDPNRIFSSIGIDKTLSKYNTKFPSHLSKKVKSFADSLLNIIIPKVNQKYLVATHNNTENDFSVLSYKNSSDSKDVFVSKKEDIDDFFIVTLLEDFNYLKGLDQNVVLQSEKAEDDGSLSIYSQKNKVPYINIEAQHGHKAKQMKMIQIIYSLIKNKKQ
jgi:hypothetical protein